MKINKISSLYCNFNNKYKRPAAQKEEIYKDYFKTDCYDICIPVGHFEQSCNDSLSWLFASREKGQQVYRDIVQTYSQPQRGYHDKNHLEAMIASFDKYMIVPKNSINVKNPKEFRYAILMHDYFNAQDDDVQKSAAYASKLLKETKKDYDTNYITSLILATDYSNPLPNLGFEQQLMQDLDILVLGQSKKKYDKYAEKIRQQYIRYPDEIYNKERVKVLNGFMRKENIFNISYFQEQYENPARENIMREINFLS